MGKQKTREVILTKVEADKARELGNQILKLPHENVLILLSACYQVIDFVEKRYKVISRPGADS